MNRTMAGITAEFIGTLALMLVGGGAILNAQGLVSVALAHGLILSVMVSAFMHISGGQFNPAVSIALAIIGKQPWPRAIVFATAQLGGAVAGAVILSVIYTADQQAAGKLGATIGALTIGDAGSGLAPSAVKVLALEAIATALLMFVILGTAVDQRGVGKSAAIGGFGIGLCVAANIFFFGPLTGASMNPARTFGPALVGGHWVMHGVYWAGPIAGAALAALLWRLVLGGADPAPKSEPA